MRSQPACAASWATCGTRPVEAVLGGAGQVGPGRSRQVCGQDNLNAAVALWDRIEATATGLVAFPLRGRPGRRNGTRELVVTGTPYVLIYRTAAERVEVLRVLHGARRWPPGGGRARP